MVKIFGVGNIFRQDDGIGVRVVDKIQDRLRSLREDIEVIIGGTDNLYCLNKIKDVDIVIIIDSTNFMMRPGMVTCRDFQQCDDLISEIYTSCNEDLLKVLRTNRREVQGYLIGIEIGSMDYTTELSKNLSNKFDIICDRVYDHVCLILGITKFL